MCGRTNPVSRPAVSAAVVEDRAAAFSKAQDAAFNRTLAATNKARTNKKGNLTVVVFDTLNDIIIARGTKLEPTDDEKNELVRVVGEAIRRVNNA